MDIKEINKKINKIVIDKLFLAKTLIILLVMYILIIGINVFYSQNIYSKILDNIEKKEVMVIDYNGNKSFEQIGTINLDIVSLFTRQSLRRILELSYENKFSLFYARNFVSTDVYENLEKNYENMEEQLKLENGYYSLDFIDLSLKNMDEMKKEYIFEAKISLKYIYDGGSKTEEKNIIVKVTQNKNIENNYFGLIISDLKEVVVTIEK